MFKTGKSYTPEMHAALFTIDRNDGIGEFVELAERMASDGFEFNGDPTFIAGETAEALMWADLIEWTTPYELTESGAAMLADPYGDNADSEV